jgi:hypothetical protein
MAEPATASSFDCAGVIDDAMFYKTKALLEAMSLASETAGLGELTITTQALLEPAFNEHLSGEVQRLRGAAFDHSDSVLIIKVRLNRPLMQLSSNEL